MGQDKCIQESQNFVKIRGPVPFQAIINVVTDFKVRYHSTDLEKIRNKALLDMRELQENYVGLEPCTPVGRPTV